MKHVLIPTKLNSVARDLLGQKGFIVVQNTEKSLTELAKDYPQTQALIVRSDKVTAEVIEALPKLKLVVRAGAGFNTIDTKYARRKGIDVMNTPGANANAVAEEVFAIILSHYRHLIEGDVTTRKGLWEKKRLMGRELAGKTMGIVGLGNIGQLVVKHAQGFDMTLLGYDPVIAARKAEDIGVKLVDLETLFKESDIITLHVPETKDTKGMVNRSLLELMKPNATLINCARAGILVEDDIRALKAEKKIGFCTDVYAEDTAGEKTCTDIADIMLPHLGASTAEANYNAARRAAEQLVAYVERGVTRYVVNKGVPDDLDEIYQQLAYHIALFARHYLGEKTSVRRIECSFYGGLDQYAKWFLSPIVAGISTDFDSLYDPQDAEAYLKEKGITFDFRDTDESKGYGKSMTIDLIEGNDSIKQLSIRGTIAEASLMISRINKFDKIYFELEGHCLVVVYPDRTGVLAKIAGACAEADINIDDIRAPHDSTGKTSMAFLRTNKPVPEEVVAQIRQEIQPEVVFALSIP